VAPCLQFNLWTKYRAREGTQGYDVKTERSSSFLYRNEREIIIGSIPEQGNLSLCWSSSQADQKQRKTNILRILKKLDLPILVISPFIDHCFLFKEDGIYVPPESFFMDIKGPFVFTKEQDLLAQRIIKKNSIETIPITDGEWGSQTDVVRMVENMCVPKTEYYQIWGLSQYMTMPEINTLVISVLKKLQSQNEGKSITWDEISLDQVEWIISEISKCCKIKYNFPIYRTTPSILSVCDN